MMLIPGAVVLLLSGAGSLLANESVLLRSGFTLTASSHEIHAGIVRLHTPGGIIELPESEVAAIVAADPSPPDSPTSPPTPQQPPAPATRPDPTGDPKAMVREAAERFGLPEALLHSVARVESGFRQNAVSPKGALGVMQLMPSTAAALEVDPSNLRDNVHGGARYLTELLLRYQRYPDQVRRALAAYNAGPGAVDRYDGIPPFSETVRYVMRVLTEYRRLAPAHHSQPPPTSPANATGRP